VTTQATQMSARSWQKPQPTIGAGLLMTAIIWLASRSVVTLRWPPARNPLHWQPSNWFAWDTSNYMSIALHGRTYGLCGTPGFPMPFDKSTVWCGTAAWFPGFPWIMALVHSFGIEILNSGVIVTNIALVVAIFLAWFGWARTLPFPRAFFILLLFVVFPGAAYNFAAFPMSLTLAFLVGALLAAKHRHYFVMALLLNCAGICYPSALFAIAGITIGLVILARTQDFTTMAKRAAWGISGFASIVGLAIHDQIAFGHYNTYLILHNEVSGANYFPGIPDFYLNENSLGTKGVTLLFVQLILACAVIFGALFLTWTTRNLDLEHAADLLPALAGVAIVIGLLLQGTAGAWNRSIVIAAPAALALRSLPLKYVVPLTMVTAAVTAIISVYLFRGTFI